LDFGILFLWHFGIFHYLEFCYFVALVFSTILDFGFPIVLDFELWILDFFIDIILGENTVTRQKYLLTDETGRLRRLR